MFWPEGIGEWQSVKNSQPKGEYFWNRHPLWGYTNEADPAVMEQQIEEAVAHGVNVFIYDWYWYDGRPFLENCLNDGFLQAKNRDKMQFYLMWANHNANNCWNINLSDDYPETVIWRGDVDRDEFEVVVHRVVERYFTQPNYYKIGGCPVFMIYDVNNLINGLGKDMEVLHVHDNDKWHDNHAEPFTMGIDFEAVVNALREVGYRGDMTLEVGANFSSDDEAGALATLTHFADTAKRLREMFEQK